MAAEGYSAEFVFLSDTNASDFVGRTSLPIFRDPVSGRPAWKEMDPTARKHDTFVYDRAGEQVLFWDASASSLSEWRTDIRAAVEAQGM